jgi:hypothetical protein
MRLPKHAAPRNSIFDNFPDQLGQEHRLSIKNCVSVVKHMLEVMAAGTAVHRQQKVDSMTNETVKREGDGY